MKHLRVSVAAAGAALIALATPAVAAPELNASEILVEADVRSVSLTLSAEGLAPGTGLDPASLTATVDGRALPTASVSAASGQEQVAAPKVLLVVDTSGSMAGQPMSDAKDAISSFITQAPAEVELGLLAFATSPRLLVEPTRDRSIVLAAVTGLEPQGETSLYDAVQAGVAALGKAGERRLVVLSDGGDTRSAASLEQALAAVSGTGVAVDTIGFNTEESVQDVLGQVARSGGGRVHSAASAAELSAALSSTVRRHASALTVRLLVPSDVRGQRTLTISATTAGGRLQTSTPVALGTYVAPASTPVTATWWSSRNALLSGLVAIAVSLVLGTVVLLGGGSRDRQRTKHLLERFTTSSVTHAPATRGANPVARTALELAERVTTSRGRQDRSAALLARAAVAMSPAEWLLLQTGCALGLTLLLVLLGWHLVAALVVGGLVGMCTPTLYVKLRGGRRQRAFEEQLPDALQMTASSLSAGYSLAQALDGLVREGSEPIATEIGRALAESRLGVGIEVTLEGVADRMSSKDFAWVVMAIKVQREVGGNLADVLTTVSATMRERAMIRRQVRGLSAEGRLSAYILIGLPVFLALYMLTMRRDYIEPLYTTALGIGLIAAAVLLLSVGSLVMSRMVKVEV